MPFDRAAHRQQVARIVTHAAGEEVLLRLNGKGDWFPATIAAERPKASQASPDLGAKVLELVTIAVACFAGLRLPAEGDSFVDQQGRLYPIHEDRSVSHASTLLYAVGGAAANRSRL